jgi:acyl carrier protein
MNKGIGDIEAFIVDWLKEQLEQVVDIQANFAAVGMDSIDAVQLTDDLAQFIGVEELPVSVILEHPTAADLARHLADVAALAA